MMCEWECDVGWISSDCSLALIAWGKSCPLSRLVRDRMLRRRLPEAAERAVCGWIAGVLDDPPGFPYTPPVVRCPGGREATPPTMWAGSSHNPLQSFAFASGAVSKPVGWCSRSGCSPQCRCRRIWGCWGSFQTFSAVSGRRGGDVPSSALASVWADHVRSSVMWTQRNLKLLLTRLHRCLVDGDGVCFSALSPEIHHQLLGLVDVEWEVVLLAPFSQGTHLLSVGRSSLSVIRPITVVSSANLTMTLELCVAVQSCVYSSTGVGWGRSPAGHQCWGSGEMRCLLPILTTWLLPVRKSRSSCTEICSVPESGASQPVWQALWC